MDLLPWCVLSLDPKALGLTRNKNFVGLKKSKASKAVLVTLTSVFPQCRAFGDGFEDNQGPNDITNMVR